MEGEGHQEEPPERFRRIIHSQESPLPKNERVEGIKDEKWAGWLVQKKEEVTGISNPKLMIEIRLLARAPDEQANADFLRASYSRIDDMIRNNEISDDAAAEWQGRITDRLMELDTAERVSKTEAPVGSVVEGEGMNERLIRALEGIPPEQERERWADVEYENEFYTRFQPDHEPRFYKDLPTKKERDLYDARWQLARAAYVKKAIAAFPDKFAENQDLLLLGKDKMELLYNEMPGVRKMLEAYVGEILNEKSGFWKCKDQKDFEKFRVGLRGGGIKIGTRNRDQSGKKRGGRRRLEFPLGK